MCNGVETNVIRSCSYFGIEPFVTLSKVSSRGLVQRCARSPHRAVIVALRRLPSEEESEASGLGT